MKKKFLIRELINDGFERTDNGLFEKTIENTKLSIGIDSSPFGITMLNIYIYFKRELPFEDDLLGEIWDKSKANIEAIGNGLELGALDTEWICGIVKNKLILKDIDLIKTKKFCEDLMTAIKPIADEYDI